METKYTEIIDKYLNGELRGEALTAFKEKLKSDPVLQKELRLEQDINQIMSDEDALVFRQEVSDVRREMLEDKPNREPKPVKPLISPKKWMLIAASIIVLAGLIGYLYIMQNRSLSYDRLYASYYRPYPADVLERSDDQSMNNELIRGLSAYKHGDFKTAKNLLGHYLKADSSNYAGHLFLGIACMETQSFPEAIRHFKIIIDENNNLFIEQAQWYLALSYLKNSGDQHKGTIRELLQALSNTKGDRAGEAEALLGKLDTAH